MKNFFEKCQFNAYWRPIALDLVYWGKGVLRVLYKFCEVTRWLSLAKSATIIPLAYGDILRSLLFLYGLCPIKLRMLWLAGMQKAYNNDKLETKPQSWYNDGKWLEIY